MIEHLSVLDLENIAAQGGSLEVNGVALSSSDLGNIAAQLAHGATLKIFNSNSKSASEMGNIAARKPGQVIFS